MFGKKSRKTSVNESKVEKKPEPSQIDGRLHAEGLGVVWAAVTGKNPAHIMPQVVATVLHEGGTRQAWQWKCAGQEHILMAWPQDQPIRAAVLMAGPDQGQLRPMTAVPLIEGFPNDLLVAEVHPRKEGMGGDVAVEMFEGKKPMWFFDPLFGRDRQDLTPGVTHTFWLGAIALKLRKALLDDVAITSGPQFDTHAKAWLEANPGKSSLDVPPLKINVRGQHFIMPGQFFGEYQLRATVGEIDDCKLEEMPLKALYLSFPFEDRQPMRMPLYVSKYVLGDYEPQEGDEIEAYAWFEGRIIDLETG